MEEIKLNLENLSKEEREQLMKLVEKANKSKVERLKPTEESPYFYINSYLGIHRCLWGEDAAVDKIRLSLGNVFKTKEEAEFAVEKRKVEVELQDTADELNDGWEPDWNDYGQKKYYLYFNHHHLTTTKIDVNYTEFCAVGGNLVYFSSTNLARKAIDEIGAERLKKYYFGVK